MMGVMKNVTNAQKKRSKKWWIIGGSVIGFLVIMWAVGTQLPDEPAQEATAIEEVETTAPPAEPKEDKKADPAPSEQKAKPNPEKTTPKEPEPEEESLAALVEQKINDNFPGGIGTGSPLFAVTEYEDVSSGTVRIYVQDALTKDERETVSRHVFNLGGYDNDALKTVVVRDSSGVDSNHYR